MEESALGGKGSGHARLAIDAEVTAWTPDPLDSHAGSSAHISESLPGVGCVAGGAILMGPVLRPIKFPAAEDGKRTRFFPPSFRLLKGGTVAWRGQKKRSAIGTQEAQAFLVGYRWRILLGENEVGESVGPGGAFGIAQGHDGYAVTQYARRVKGFADSGEDGGIGVGRDDVEARFGGQGSGERSILESEDQEVTILLGGHLEGDVAKRADVGGEINRSDHRGGGEIETSIEIEYRISSS